MSRRVRNRKVGSLAPQEDGQLVLAPARVARSEPADCGELGEGPGRPPPTGRPGAAVLEALEAIPVVTCGFHGFWPPCFARNGHPVSPETATLFHG